MLRSIPLTEGGTLIAVAAQGDAGWYLISIDTRLQDLDRRDFADAATAERTARCHLRLRRALDAGQIPMAGPSASGTPAA